MKKLLVPTVGVIVAVILAWYFFRTSSVEYSMGTYRIHHFLGRIVKIDCIDHNGVCESSTVYSWKRPYRNIGCGPEPLLLCEYGVHDANLDGKWDAWFTAVGKTNDAVLIRCDLDTNWDAKPDISMYISNEGTSFNKLNSEVKKLRGFGIWKECGCSQHTIRGDGKPAPQP